MKIIADALVNAKFPLVITSYVGRNIMAAGDLSSLATLLSIGIFTSCPSAVNFTYDDPAYLGSSFGGKNDLLDEADVILIVDADVPWIDIYNNNPKPSTKVFVIDSDPLKQGMQWFHVDADMICKAESETALHQLLMAMQTEPYDSRFADEKFLEQLAERKENLSERHDAWIKSLVALENSVKPPSMATAPFVLRILRTVTREMTPSLGKKILWINEGISHYPTIFDHIRPDRLESMICSGATSLGYSLGAAVGASLGGRAVDKQYELIVVIVGDGSFLFGVPSAAYWMARRYNTPYLTIVLNNGGWASPKNSMLGIYPEGKGSQAAGSRLSVGFGPDSPDYSQIAAAAGGAWGRRVENSEEVEITIRDAIQAVLYDNRCAVVDCVLESI